MDICEVCPLFVNRNGGICNSSLWLNVETGDVSSTPKDGYKKGCGCLLQYKVKGENAKCPVGKW